MSKNSCIFSVTSFWLHFCVSFIVRYFLRPSYSHNVYNVSFQMPVFYSNSFVSIHVRFHMHALKYLVCRPLGCSICFSHGCRGMTLNGVMTVILRFSPNSVYLRADYIKVVEDKPTRSAKEMSPNNLVFSDISLMAIFAEVTENEGIIYRHLHRIHPLLDYDASENQSIISM